MKLTSGKLLRSMGPGRGYRAGELAAWFDTSTAQINDMLCTVVEDGLVRMNSHATRIIRFERLAFQPAQPVPRSCNATQLQTSIATPPVTRTMQGALRGYEASLETLRGFAMLARNSHHG
ncbi:hypothetical protein R69746_07896 [Paraburkholderia aspalathi]|uniref:hypothetical protein n=1 Tax=Paraburkholderia aspalathi TaxID=1324617 RepID=UPI001909EACD|nr:hypothetical protein [Paraburkholderia aspalathi]MBK3843849.1 hypothetical protein [Paraburkholderia aspalathi]CAE6862565.1 hypothetical protein R69746_07896 [Paraburkholderia aspalathi]